MATAQVAVRRASDLVAQAIAELTGVGPDAPVAVREALACLGGAFTQLGYIDPGVKWGIESDGDQR